MRIIDAFAFCRNGERQAGSLQLSELTRLRAECVSDQGKVEWILVGETPGQLNGYPTLRLAIDGTVQLLCQRCLTPYVFSIKSNSTILLAKDEWIADEIDSFLHNDEIEVIVGSKAFDVLTLVEDEALLAIPLSPKHEVCPAVAKLDKEKITENVKKESPFAVLKDQLSGKPRGKIKN